MTISGCLWKRLHMETKKARKWKGMILWSSTFTATKYWWKHTKIFCNVKGSKGQILRSGEIPESKDSLCSLKKRECVMSWGPNCQRAAIKKHWGTTLGPVPCMFPLTACSSLRGQALKSWWERRSCRCFCHLAILGSHPASPVRQGTSRITVRGQHETRAWLTSISSLPKRYMTSWSLRFSILLCPFPVLLKII